MISFLSKAPALEVEQQGLVPCRFAGAEHVSNSRADVGPDFSPNFVGATANHPIALNAHSRQVGIVAEECQFGPPGHPHRETGGQHDANHSAQG